MTVLPDEWIYDLQQANDKSLDNILISSSGERNQQSSEGTEVGESEFT